MIITITVIITVLAVLPVVIYNMARADKQFTFLKTGEIKFIVSGESFIRLIMDVPGWRYNKDTDEIIKGSNPSLLGRLQKLVMRGPLSGIYYVSIWYPYVRVWDWVFEWDKQTREADKVDNKVDNAKDADKEKTASSDGYRIVHRKEWVDSLYFEFPYPVRPKGLELKHGGLVDIRARFVLQIVKPKYLVFTLNGAWYPAAINALDARIADFVKQMTLEDMYDPAKANSTTFNAWFMSNPLILVGAIRIEEAIFEGFDVAGAKETREAVEEQRVSKIRIKTRQNEGIAKAKLLHEEAKGEAAAILAKGEATAKAARMLGDALGHQRERLGDALMDKKLGADTVAGFRGTALSLGGGGHQVLVSAPVNTDEKGGVS